MLVAGACYLIDLCGVCGTLARIDLSRRSWKEKKRENQLKVLVVVVQVINMTTQSSISCRFVYLIN